MPINIPENLPAYAKLCEEGVMVMTTERAQRQDIRPLEIGLINLMPKKEETETQLARLIGATPLQINLTLIRMTSHESRNASKRHLEEFYCTFEETRSRKYDGLIITGAPIEHLEYERVNYWNELVEVFEWARTHVHWTLGLCWAGMALLSHWRNIPKRLLPSKTFGCFEHQLIDARSPFMRGFSDQCQVPVSRWAECTRDDIARSPALNLLLDSAESGPCIVEDASCRYLCIFNHFEYDNLTLDSEYRRDVDAGRPIEVPRNYYPDDNPGRAPRNKWRSHGHVLYANWINYIYQTTPYDIEEIGLAQLPR
ncbi:MAG: homoserine O-succinyltransferase [Rhodobacteraceae bacterium]|nr:homoserine O-succinyltransferase [Paracoccaceae bacterium]